MRYVSGEGSSLHRRVFSSLEKNEACLLPLRKSWVNAEIDFPVLCALHERDAKRHWNNSGRGACTPDLLLPSQVAQYIKFEMPVLKSFIQKLQEEEDREVKKLMRK